MHWRQILYYLSHLYLYQNMEVYVRWLYSNFLGKNSKCKSKVAFIKSVIFKSINQFLGKNYFPTAEKKTISVVLFPAKWTHGHGRLPFYVLHIQFSVLINSLLTSGEFRNTCSTGRKWMICLPSLVVGASQAVHIPSWTLLDQSLDFPCLGNLQM